MWCPSKTSLAIVWLTGLNNISINAQTFKFLNLNKIKKQCVMWDIKIANCLYNCHVHLRNASIVDCLCNRQVFVHYVGMNIQCNHWMLTPCIQACATASNYHILKHALSMRQIMEVGPPLYSYRKICSSKHFILQTI